MISFRPLSAVSAKNRTSNWFKRFQTDLALDFGSAQTRLLKDGNLVWHQPTIIAWHKQQEAVLAVGQEAADLTGKTSSAVELVEPIKNGVVVNLELASLYLRAVFKKIQVSNHWLHFLPDSLITSCPTQASPLEKEQLRQVIIKAGCQPLPIVSKSEAFSALISLSGIRATHGVLAVGAETLEIGVFSDQELLAAETLSDPNHQNLTRVIQDQVLTEYGLRVDWRTAQKLKHELGDVGFKSSSQKLTVKGKDIRDRDIVTVKVEAEKFQAPLQDLVLNWVQVIRQFLRQISPTAMTQLQEQGFYLTGGGSQLFGLPDFLSQQLQLPVVKSSQPELDLVEALWRYRQKDRVVES